MDDQRCPLEESQEETEEASAPAEEKLCKQAGLLFASGWAAFGKGQTFLVPVTEGLFGSQATGEQLSCPCFQP